MSNSISADEDWSIISSSSDFEEEPTTASSINESGPEAEVANLTAANETSEEIDESTCTIEQGTELKELPQAVEGEPVAETSEVAEEHVFTPPFCSSQRKCAMVGAATGAAALICRVDRRVRAASSQAYAYLLGAIMGQLKAEVATQATDKIGLHKHAAYSVLQILENNQELLIYQIIAFLISAMAAAYWFVPAPLPELTYTEKLQQFWGSVVYEPQEVGISRYFHAAKPKKLKAEKYIDAASRQAYGMWVHTKHSAQPHLESLTSHYKPVLEQAGVSLKSELGSLAHRFGAWKSGVSASAVKDCAANVQRSTSKLADDLKSGDLGHWLCAAKLSSEKWLSSVASPVIAASDRLSQRVAASDFVPQIQKYLKLGGCTTSKWLHVSAKQWEEFLRTRLLPWTLTVQEQIGGLLSKTEAHTRVAAVQASRFLNGITNSLRVQLNKSWTAFQTWHAEVCADL